MFNNHDGFEQADWTAFVLEHPELKRLAYYFAGKVYLEKSTEDECLYRMYIEANDRYRFSVVMGLVYRQDGTQYWNFIAGVNNRCERPFEDWTRGNDLCDGELSESTVDRFIQRVIDWQFATFKPEERNPTLEVKQA
jgi:hypothetical protein